LPAFCFLVPNEFFSLTYDIRAKQCFSVAADIKSSSFFGGHATRAWPLQVFRSHRAIARRAS
jgi:hypothetical protein